MTPVSQLIDWGYWLVPWSRNPRKPLVQEWQTKKPNAAGFLRAYGDTIDWAIVPKDGVVVLDIEMKGGLNGMADLLEFAMTAVGPRTQTKSGGFHLWYKEPKGAKLQGGHHIRPGIEAKAVNGSVHVPPSLQYISLNDILHPDHLPILPAAMVDAWQTTARIRAQSTQSYQAIRYPESERRKHICSMAGRLRSAGLTETELIASLLAVRDCRCDNPSTFSDDEIIGIAKDYATRQQYSEPSKEWMPKS